MTEKVQDSQIPKIFVNLKVWSESTCTARVSVGDIESQFCDDSAISGLLIIPVSGGISKITR